jgi:acyl-CoA synthetase (AMP-forming)/AMP-acid ligase II
MSDPLAVLPLALAAGGGRVDGHDAARLVAAGLTLLRRSAPLVRALQGRRAAVLLPTAPAFVTALAACDGRGAVLVNPLAAAREIAYQLADADVGAVFTNAALAAKLPPDVPRVLLDAAPHGARVEVGGEARDVDLARTRRRARLAATRPPRARRGGGVVYTSAMAGRPLGAVLTHRNLVANGRATVEAGGFTPLDHSLAVLPFTHLFGLVVSGVAPLLAGGRVTTMARFNPITAADLVAREGVTAIVGVPAVFAALPAGDRAPRRARRPRAARVHLRRRAARPRAAGALARGHGRGAAPGVRAHRGGAGVPVQPRRPPQPRRHARAPLPGVAVEVQDPATGAACPPGATGEICVRGDNVGPGYVRGGAAGLERRGPWLRTGDLGVADADGYVAFRGLLKPMFTRNGFNIYPREIEQAVLELPGVRRVVVRAVPEPAREHDIALAVEGRRHRGRGAAVVRRAAERVQAAERR